VGDFLRCDMEKADFYEVHGAIISCPYCGHEIELDICRSPYRTGERITCPACKKVFELGESL